MLQWLSVCSEQAVWKTNQATHKEGSRSDGRQSWRRGEKGREEREGEEREGEEMFWDNKEEGKM